MMVKVVIVIVSVSYYYLFQTDGDLAVFQSGLHDVNTIYRL